VILRKHVAAARTGAAQNRARHMLLIAHGMDFAPVFGEDEYRGDRDGTREVEREISRAIGKHRVRAGLVDAEAGFRIGGTWRNHDTHSHADEALESCPLCGSTLTGARYREAMARMERVEKERMAALEASLKARFAEQQQRAAAKAAVDIAKARADAGAQVEKIRKEAAKTAAAALAPKIAEAVQAERTKAYGDKLAMEQQLEELKRKLQRNLDGRQPRDLTADKLLAHSRLPLAWHEQRTVLGFA
jgi:hypothetical protein